MNITPFEIYVLLTLDRVVGLFVALTSFGTIALVFVWIILMLYRNEEQDAPRYYFLSLKISALVTVISLILATLIPSTRTAIAMLAIPTVANSEAANKVPDLINKSLDLIDRRLDEALKKK